jgi:hypothetical protein
VLAVRHQAEPHGTELAAVDNRQRVLAACQLGRQREIQLVHQAGLEEGGVQARATLAQDPPGATRSQVMNGGGHVAHAADFDAIGEADRRRGGDVDPCGRFVVGVLKGQIATGGDDRAQWMRRQSAGLALLGEMSGHTS